MPKKKTVKKSGRKLKTLYESRRLALRSAMAEKQVSVVELAKRLEPSGDVTKFKARQGRISYLRRPSNPGKLQQEEATVIAEALGVPLARLLAGELTPEETTAAGGGRELTAAADRAALLKDRAELGAERRRALKEAMGKAMKAGMLYKKLVAAGKNWSQSQVNCYVNGLTLPSKDFLTDVAPLLGADIATLVVREHPLEYLGRHTKNKVPDRVVASPLSAAGLTVYIACGQLRIKMTDEISFNKTSQQFAGTSVKVRRDGEQYHLEVSVPIGPQGVAALLGLVVLS